MSYWGEYTIFKYESSVRYMKILAIHLKDEMEWVLSQPIAGTHGEVLPFLVLIFGFLGPDYSG